MISLPALEKIPKNLRLEGAITIEIQEGTPIFRASTSVQNHIENLLTKQQNTELTPEEEQELDSYEEIDDYLSLLNRLVRNIAQNKNTIHM
jgi:hypothetical protein